MIADFDWSSTSLGPIENWPQSLKTASGFVVHSSVPMVMLWGEDGLMIYNDAYSVFAGARHPALLGSKVREGWSEVAAFNDNVMKVVLGGGTLAYRDQELTLYRNGAPEQVWMNLDYSPVRDESGTPAGVIAIVVETTERVRGEEALTRSEGRLSALNADLEQRVIARSQERGLNWQVSPDLLGVLNAEGYFESSNPAWRSILGWSQAEVASMSIFELLHPDDVERTRGGFELTLAGQPAIRFENRYRCKDGSYRWISWVGIPEVGKIYCSGRDITADKQQAQDLAQAQAALRQSHKLEAMGQLTGGVAHDFNNLLTPIVGSLDMLLRRGVGDERERRLIDGALQSAERAKTLVQRLLAFSRRQPLQPSAVDVGRLIAGMADLVSSTTGPQIKVVVEAPEALPAASADPNQLEMAILNLSVNARDAMEEGGTLRISAAAEVVGPEHRSKLEPGPYVCISVADTGVGMSEATLARAIEPFFSTKGIGKGTGLGLSMAHGLTSQLGGGLRLSSRLGLGTHVELWLPVSPEAAPALPSGPAAVPVAKAIGTALLVDDEALVRASTADMLAELGYDVVQADCGEVALELIEGGLETDVLVTDHLMPGMSGVDLARSLQSHRPGARVLIVSGYAEAEGIAPDLARLTKPFRQADLANALAGLG